MIALVLDSDRVQKKVLNLAKPFIQFFKTPRNQYIFDVNSNKILPVSEAAFAFLRQCMTGEADVRTSNLAEIKNLTHGGYLCAESNVEEIRHPYTQHLECFLNRKIRKITLQLTQRCKLRCKYCIYSENSSMHQRTHSSKRMDWETAKNGIDFLWKHSIDSSKVNIGFYGGDYDCINEITVSSADMNEHVFLASIVDKEYDEEEAAYSEEYFWKYRYHRF